jgi:hypothetical protein
MSRSTLESSVPPPPDRARDEIGIIHDVTDEGWVSIESPTGRRMSLRVPLEQVPHYRSLVGSDWRRLPPR